MTKEKLSLATKIICLIICASTLVSCKGAIETDQTSSTSAEISTELTSAKSEDKTESKTESGTETKSAAEIALDSITDEEVDWGNNNFSRDYARVRWALTVTSGSCLRI